RSLGASVARAPEGLSFVFCWPNDMPVLNTENIFSISILANQPGSSPRRTFVGCLGILIAELVRTIERLERFGALNAV
ncbi:MAG TPA: hypothetical protein VFA40_23730, partial [Terriglobales bacterium]|nr:hypothetical protein [Terriglobales bacterium]